MGEEKPFETVGTMSIKEVRKAMMEEGYSQEFFDKIDKISQELKTLEKEFATLMQEELNAGKKGDEVLTPGSKSRELSERISELKMKLEKAHFEERLRIAKDKDKYTRG